MSNFGGVYQFKTTKLNYNYNYHYDIAYYTGHFVRVPKNETESKFMRWKDGFRTIYTI